MLFCIAFKFPEHLISKIDMWQKTRLGPFVFLDRKHRSMNLIKKEIRLDL